jgi:hypothetical protein
MIHQDKLADGKEQHGRSRMKQEISIKIHEF